VLGPGLSPGKGYSIIDYKIALGNYAQIIFI